MPDKCEKYKKLMMGLIDNELTSEEAIDVNNHLTRCTSCRQEFEELKRSSASLKDLNYDKQRDIELDKIWKTPYSKFAKYTGIIMIITGWIAVIIFSLIEIIKSNREPLVSRLSTIVIIAGFIILLLLVIHERIKTYKSDPYKEVER